MSLDISRTNVVEQLSRPSRRQGTNRSGRSSSRPRNQQLRTEPLEERALLSVTALSNNADPFDVLVTDDFVDNYASFGDSGRPLASDFDGDFVIAWVEDRDIWARQYFRDGTPMDDQFRVNTTTAGRQFEPTVAMDADGDFVVVWTGDAAEYGSGTDIFARRFNSVGVAQGVDFRVNTSITNPQFTPTVDIDVEGSFVVAWANEGQTSSYFNHISSQRYDRFGSPVGAERVINTIDTHLHRNPDLQMGRDGRFVIAWDTFDLVNDLNVVFGVHAMVIDVAGTTLIPQFFVPKAVGTAGSFAPTVDIDTDNNFYIAYEGTIIEVPTDNGGFGFSGVFARMYDALGNPVQLIPGFNTNADVAPEDPIRQEFHVDSIPYGIGPPDWSFLRPDGWDTIPLYWGDQFAPTLSVDADGDFTIGYNGYGPDLRRTFPFIPGQYGQGVFFPEGDPNAAMISQFAASALPGDGFQFFDTIHADAVVNTKQDAMNDVWQFQVVPPDFGPLVDPSIIEYSGTFTISIFIEGIGSITEEITLDPRDFFTMLEDLENKLSATPVTGLWEEDGFATPVVVTPFDLTNFIFEIKFQEAVHDRVVFLSIDTNDTMAMATIEVTDPMTGETEEVTFEAEPVELVFTSLINPLDIPGTTQLRTIVDVQPDGDFIVAWQEYETGEIIYRRFDELTDTAGPVVTDLLTVDNEPISEGDFLFETVQKITFAFDEAMDEASVTNPANWAINRLDGDFPQQISRGIVDIEYGLNKSFELGLSPAATNKWEAVVTFDANGPLPGVTPLEDGVYEVVATEAIRDKSLNSLGRTGFVPGGEAFTRGFRIQLPDGSETRANSTTAGDQFTESPQTIAGDADGDYAIVWTSDGQDGDGLGVFAQLYSADRTPRGPEFQVNTTTAGDQDYPSIAMDSDGDFTVTWTSFSDETLWDIYAQRYDSAGNPIGGEFLVNAETESIQRYSTVAMDNDGDFVITWQSYQQDESGYGIYAQRYSREGYRVGGFDENQLISISGVPTGGSFTLNFDGNITEDIEFTTDDDGVGTAENIRVALLPFAKVEVIPTFPVSIDPGEIDPITVTNYRVIFVEEDGSTDQVELIVEEDNLEGSGILIEIETINDGTQGEFRVNSTTANNQTRPAVSARADGQFVVTWETAGQFGDALNRTNIMARRFDSNDAVKEANATTLQNVELAASFGNPDDRYVPFITTTDDPEDYVVDPGAGFDGVVQLFVGGFICTGSLLSTGRHILTAAHCVDGLLASDVSVRFDLPSGQEFILASEIFVHPEWSPPPNGVAPYDIAVIELIAQAPAEAERYDIYRGSSEVGSEFTVVGYGTFGNGDEGNVNGSDLRKRSGNNVFEDDGTLLAGIEGSPWLPGTQLAFDFDNGNAENDFFGVTFGINDTGLGSDEVNTAGGDSGGPSFINGLIAGVTSFGGSRITDIDDVTNSTFGELSAVTRVSAYAGFVDASTGLATSSFPLGPEFLVNDLAFTTDQFRPDVAMDIHGDFVITWTSYGQEQGNLPGAYPAIAQNGVYARRFEDDGIAIDGEFQVNTVTKSDQQNSRVAVEADGDFYIVWESLQDFDSTNTTGDPDSLGIYARRYVPSSDISGPNGEFGLPLRMNETVDGDQHLAGVTSDHDGAVVYAWSGNGEQSGQQDNQGVFFRRFDALDLNAGPIITDLVTFNNDTLIVRFSEDLNTNDPLGADGVKSVTNVENWFISRNGLVIDEAVASVEFGLDKAFELGLTSGELFKYEAVVTLAAPLQSNLEHLLTILDFVEDVDGNRLDGDYSGEPGEDFNGLFLIEGPGDGPGVIGPVGPEIDVNMTTDNNQRDSAVAVDADGNFVVVWTSVVGVDILAQRFDANGIEIGLEFMINEFTTLNQDLSQIVMADDGSFLVVWNGNGPNDDDPTGMDPTGIYGRMFNADGTPQAGQFAINTSTTGTQKNSSVTVDDNGDFVVAWSDYGVGATGAVRARRFDSSGAALGNDFLVTTDGSQSPSVASDAAGNFVVVWAQFNTEGLTGFDVFAQLYDTDGLEVGVPLPVNDFVDGNQGGSKVAMDDDGNFVVVWNSFEQDSSGDGVFGRRFDPSGVKQGDEFRANTSIFGDQNEVDLHMDGIGNFTLVWTGDFSDDDGTGVLVRRYTSDGAPLGVEEIVNTTTTGDQDQPAVGANDFGQAVVSWTGDDIDLVSDFTDIFAQRYNFGSAVFGTVPTVMEVTIGGTTSTHADYSVPDGNGSQLRTIEVGGPDQITIRFSEDVNIVQSDLSVVGSVNGIHTFSDFSYSAVSRTATWTVNGLSQADELTLTLDDGVTAKTGGEALDGEWNNPVDLADVSSSTFPSGNGQAGGDFVFNIRVLPGDANQDSIVDGFDYITWALNNDTIGGATFTDADFNGDGNVDGLDYIAWAINIDTDQTALLSGSIQTGQEDFADLYITFATNFGSDVAPGTAGDLNGDGQVDGSDYLAILSHLNLSSSSTASAPVAVSSYSQTPQTPLPVVATALDSGVLGSAAVVDALIGHLDLAADDDGEDDDDWFDLHTDTIDELALATVFDLDDE